MRAATFTTYINAQTDPGLEAAFARQTRVALSSYGTITKAAEEATRVTAGLLAGRGTGGIASTSRALDGNTRSNRELVTAAAATERQSVRSVEQMKREGAEARKLTTTHSGLSRSLNTTATAFSVVEGRMSPLAGRLITVARAAEQLTGVQLGLAGVGATLFALGRAGNEYATLSSRLRPFFDDQNSANRAMENVIGIAQRSRTSLESVVEIYARLTANANELGLSQQRVSRLTEFASKAATLSGGTAQARNAALVQFSQAIGSNFQSGAGQEFNSLQEGASQVSTLLARYFKNADGSIGTTIANLKKLSSEGKLTTEQIADAADRATPALERMFGAIPKTLGSAGTEFANATTVLVGRFDQSVGLTNTLAETLSLVANNLRVITGLLVGAGAGFAAVKAAAVLGPVITETIARIQEQYRATTLLQEQRRGLVLMEQGFAAQAVETDLARSRASQARIAQMEQELAATEAETAALRQQKIVADQAVASARASQFGRAPAAGTAGLGITTGAAEIKAQQATRALAEAEQKLTASRAALNAESKYLQLTNVALGASSERLGSAIATQVPKVSLLSKSLSLARGAAGSLISFLGGPWAIIFAAATTAVYLLATAESAAEKSTRLHEDAQRSFANIVDRTTGKIYDQVDALAKLGVANKLSIDVDAASGEFNKNKNQFLSTLKGIARPVNSTKYGFAAAGLVGPDGSIDMDQAAKIANENRRAPSNDVRRQLAARIDAVERGQAGSFKALTDFVSRPSVRDRDPEIRRLLPTLIKQSGDTRAAFDREQQGRAAQRVITGRAREGDLAKAFGEQERTTFGAGGPPKARTAAQINAEASARAAQSPLERSRADLAKIRADGRAANETEDQYIERLSAGITAVKSAQEAEKSLRSSRSAGAAAAKKEARDALQDAKDAAGAKLLAGQTDLEKRKPTLTQDEYLQARLALLKTYDDEVNKLDATAAASNRAGAQQLADIRKVAEAAEKSGEKRRDILASYDDAPKAVDRANADIDTLQDFVDTAVDGVAFLGKTKAEIIEISKLNPLGTGLYTQEIANADIARINPLRKAMEDINREADRGVEIARLQLQGRDAEAEALRRTYSLVDSVGRVSGEQYDQLLANVRQEQRINDLLGERQRVVGLIQGSVDSTRDDFERFLTDLPNGFGKASGNLLKNIQARITQISARSITERIFGGADEKVRGLLSGKRAVNGAIQDYVETLGTSKSGVLTLGTSAKNTAAELDKFRLAFANFNQPAAPGIGNTDVSTTPANIGAVIANTTAGGSSAAAGIAAIAAAAAGSAATKAANDNSATEAQGDPIVVVAAKALKETTKALEASKPPSARETFGAIGKAVGSNLDDVLHGIFGSGKKDDSGKYDTSKGGALGLGNTTFFGKLGDAVGKGFSGAATGSIVAGLSKTLGLKTSTTGAQIGGAIGSFLPIPGGDIIGSIAGGLLGGLLKKAKYGTAAINLNSYGELEAGKAQGNNAKRQAVATGAAKNVIDGLNSIASALGADITRAPNVSIGTYNDKYRVSTTGRTGKLKTKYADVVDFGKDGEQEAIEYAIRYAVEHAVIGGISQASINILKSGQDLDKAIQKAVAIENIGKRLLQRTDPVRYAVTELNKEFSDLISYLKEGGASAQQFADAQKLYDLERADAIKQATEQAASAISDFLKEMTGGSSSPFSKRTTYNNAASQLQAFTADITAGKAVDQTELLAAARNFEDASRALNGSSASFFADFEMLRSLLEKARDNVGVSTDTSTLPASPFADASVQAAIEGLKGATTTATETQTAAIVGRLDTLTDAVLSLGGLGGSSSTSAINELLPGFASAA